MTAHQLTASVAPRSCAICDSVVSRVTIITRKQHKQGQADGSIPGYISYNNLRQYANNYQRSHRLESYVAWQLQQFGLDAEVLPACANGDTKAKQADVIITATDGCKLALEVKEARYKGCTLGTPVNNGIDGYERLPRRLFVDSTKAWDGKEQACERRSEPLLGAIILCPIGSLSDDEFTVLGCIYCPTYLSDYWRVIETCNRGKYYDAYVCRKQQMKTLADLVADVETKEETTDGKSN